MFKCMIIKIKSLILPTLICVFILCLLLFSKSNLAAAKSGLSLWANSVLPSLLPFFIATELLGYTNIVNVLGKALNKLMRPIFNVPGAGAFALMMGIISGYPVGAKIVSNLKEQKLCTNIEAERLLAFTNNSGPLFIVGTVGVGMFYDFSLGMILFGIHVLSTLTVGFLFRWWGKNMQLKLGDIVVMKKAHPCGSKEFEITRLGVDYKLRCTGCGREVMIPRIKADKSIKVVKSDEK